MTPDAVDQALDRLNEAHLKLRDALAHAAEYDELAGIDSDWIDGLVQETEAVAEYVAS